MPSGDRPATPKPGPPPAVQRWFQEQISPYPWEQDGLDHVKRLMPKAEPYRAWATFSFTAASGRINECDLLIAVPGGLHLVEFKGHPGRVVNNGETWSFFEEGRPRPRTLRNPLHLIDVKSKDLKSRLEWAAKQLHISQRVPRVEPSVFLSAPGLESALDEVQRVRVYGRDDDSTGLPWIWRDLLARPPQRESQRVTQDFSRQLPKLLDKIGIRVSTAHLRFGDDWRLTPDILDAGPTWEDRLAKREQPVRETGRVRIYLTAQQTTEDVQRSTERAARREYQVLQGIAHRGIAQAMEIREHQGGPAIRFVHRESDLRLDSYLALHGERVTPEMRLDMIRQLGEALRYAHSRALYHRALSARSVYVSAKDDGSSPVLRLIDWQSAARDFDTSGMSSILTSTGGKHLADAAGVYLAPEFDQQYPDPVDLDVFGLGALAYLIITGQPPATQRSGLVDRLSSEGGLRLDAVVESVSEALVKLVFQATSANVGDRLDSADAFLVGLDAVEKDSLVPETTTVQADPLDAMPGQQIDGDWVVERVLGTGATARALLVRRTVEDDDDKQTSELRVFKIALDEQKADRLRAEAEALRQVGGGVVVQLKGGPRILGERTVLDLEYAGAHSLGAQLRAEGRLDYGDLERFGTDLFTALDQLAAKGVRHRDLKPDNLGVFTRADGKSQLMLFDFSLHGISEKDVKAGTRGYLDPFLDTTRRPFFDDQAERYAAAVTLHEMASAQRPVWGDGLTDPRMTTDETPTIAADLFEPALRDDLTEFFLRAFHRDINSRFDTLRQMEDAWRAVFTKADASSPATTPATVALDANTLEETREAHATAAQLTTPLEAAGLTPRAVSVAHGFGATSVGELLDIPLHKISKARGAGMVIRKELNRRHKQWTAALRRSTPLSARPSVLADGGGSTLLTIDDMAELLVPPVTGKPTVKADVPHLMLALPGESGVPNPWPTQSEVAKARDTTQATVSRHYSAAVETWADLPWLTSLRDEIVDTVTAAGRIMTALEVAAAVRAQHGAADDTPDRITAKALAVVRAAVDAESWAGLHSDDEEVSPRLAVLRRGSRVLITCESLVDTDDPNALELADYALALGKRADDLVDQEQLLGRVATVRELRAVPAPEGLAPLADTRLVELAASVSQHAADSPRLDLYPRDLELSRALRIAQAGAGVRRDNGVTVKELLSRIRARFPELVYDENTTHVVMQEALRAAGFPLEFDTSTRRFLPPAPEGPRVISSTGMSMGSASVTAAGLDPHAVIAGKIATAFERGGFLALTLSGNQLPGTADAIAGLHPVRRVDLNREFLGEFRALVADRGQEWHRVLGVDARFSESGEMPRGLASYVRAAWTRMENRLLDPELAGEVLFVHDAGLLARYFDEGGHDLLTRLQNAARRPADAPRGLWLLCPGESEREAVQLDGRTVEVLDASERVVLSKKYLAALRGEPGTAA